MIINAPSVQYMYNVILFDWYIISLILILRAGQSPSVSVIYQFYTFPDHDTAILPHSTDPHFSDDKLFPLSMDAHLDNYLKKQVCLWHNNIN